MPPSGKGFAYSWHSKRTCRASARRSVASKRCARALVRDRKGCGPMRQPVSTPLVVLGLTALVRGAKLGDRRTWAGLDHDNGRGGSLPVASWQG
jgi:hypothetical protein